ncbi:MAG: hypothetical protein ACK5RL_00025 [Acidimicrobiales bacterium]
MGDDDAPDPAGDGSGVRLPEDRGPRLAGPVSMAQLDELAAELDGIDAALARMDAARSGDTKP